MLDSKQVCLLMEGWNYFDWLISIIDYRVAAVVDEARKHSVQQQQQTSNLSRETFAAHATVGMYRYISPCLHTFYTDTDTHICVKAYQLAAVLIRAQQTSLCCSGLV